MSPQNKESLIPASEGKGWLPARRPNKKLDWGQLPDVRRGEVKGVGAGELIVQTEGNERACVCIKYPDQLQTNRP